MHCPFCGHVETKVTDSRLASDGAQIRRRRECLACEVRFSTLETAEFALPRVVKRDGTRMPFDEEKVHAGLLKALEKRPVATEEIDSVVADIVQRLRLSGEREISSDKIGAWVMEALSRLDQGAYVRFACVSHSFQGVGAFRRQIEQLEHERNRLNENQLPLLKETRRRKKK